MVLLQPTSSTGYGLTRDVRASCRKVERPFSFSPREWGAARAGQMSGE